MHAIDPDMSRRLDWLDYQLEVIGSLGTDTQIALADRLARIRAERRAILLTQPVGNKQPVR